MITHRQHIRFCDTTDGVKLAYAASGNGPVLIKSAHWLTHVDQDWHHPVWRAQHQALSQRFKLIRYDQRGCGLSDRDSVNISFPAWLDDLEAVVQAAAPDRFLLLGMSQGASIALAYARAHPERVRGLILLGGYARGRRLWQETTNSEKESDTLVDLIRLGWGRDVPAYRNLFTSLFLPRADPALQADFDQLQRASCGADTAASIVSEFEKMDVSEQAAEVRTPALVMHCQHDARVPFSEGRHLASLLPNARFVPLPGYNHILLEHDPGWDTFLSEIEKFDLETRDPADQTTASRFRELSHREMEVLEHIARGLDNRAIGESLSMAEKTVRNHVSRIFAKCGLQSRAEVIVEARNAGFGVADSGD